MGCSFSISFPHLNPDQKLQLKWRWMEPGSSLGVGRGHECNATALPPSQRSPQDGVAGVLEVLSISLLTLAPPFQVERNLLLEEKVKTLQQENEDLQVRTQNHLVMAR